MWHPPKPTPGAEKPYQDPLCVFLDDVIIELLALMHQRPASEKRGHQFPHLSPSAIPDILYALEASDCSYLATPSIMTPTDYAYRPQGYRYR